MIPETLEGWTLEMIEALLQQGVFESDRFDFKEQLPHTRADGDKLRLVKTCASFANSDGGFLIFGVRDDKGLTAGQRLVGFDAAEDFPERFGNFPSAAEPPVEWTFLNPALRLPDSRVVHVAYIAPSPRRPHAVFDQERWWFGKRTSKGTEVMSYEEIRGAFTDLRRRQRELTWLKAEVERLRVLAEKMQPDAPTATLLGQLTTRFDLAQLKAIRLSLFDDIGGNSVLVGWLDRLDEACTKANEVLGPMAAFATRPRDRSYSGAPPEGLPFAIGKATEIVIAARNVLTQLGRLPG